MAATLITIDDIRRAKELSAKGIHYVDVGTSGGVWGLERGYCQMIGGENNTVRHLDPISRHLLRAAETLRVLRDVRKPPALPRKATFTAGPSGAGHFVKMVHNGIEYGLMAAYAEGLNILKHANVGKQQHETDAETTPLRYPEHYQYDFNLADVTEVWRRGSVVASWLLDLTAISLLEQPTLERFSGRVSDSGEGRWTILAGIESGAPAPCSPKRSTSDSYREAKATSPPRFCRPCASNSRSRGKEILIGAMRQTEKLPDSGRDDLS